jgi:hypothetical protein
MREFKNINKMVDYYKKSTNQNNMELNGLDLISFSAFIYSLDTGKFSLTGFSEKSFLTYFMTSGKTDEENWAMDIVNNLPYSRDDFIDLI